MSNLAHLLYPLSCVCPAADVDNVVAPSPSSFCPFTPASPRRPSIAASLASLLACFPSSDDRGVGPELMGMGPPLRRMGGVPVAAPPLALIEDDETVDVDVAFRESCLPVETNIAPVGIVGV